MDEEIASPGAGRGDTIHHAPSLAEHRDDRVASRHARDMDERTMLSGPQFVSLVVGGPADDKEEIRIGGHLSAQRIERLTVAVCGTDEIDDHQAPVAAEARQERCRVVRAQGRLPAAEFGGGLETAPEVRVAGQDEA